MEPLQTPVRPNIVKIVANVLLVIFGLSSGAALVHGMVLQQCQVKNEVFEAGVVPSDVQTTSTQQTEEPNDKDIQECVDNGSDEPFQAGVLPNDGLAGTPEPSVQGTTPIVQKPAQEPKPPVVQTAAPAPAPQPAPKPQTPPAKPAPKPAPAPAPKKKPAPKPQPAAAKPLSYDLDKLSYAVAMTETHNCADKVKGGSALYNNCHGFRKNGKFMRFNTTAESHAYFKQLWAKSYRAYPNTRLAQIYSGNDRPTQWLKNVNYYYHSL